MRGSELSLLLAEGSVYMEQHSESSDQAALRALRLCEKFKQLSERNL
jgi:hypothetical protein